MTQLRVGVVGAGAVATLGYAPAFARAARVRPVGVVDVDAERARALAARLGVDVLPDVVSLAARADVVVVASPPQHHVRGALDALAGGAHVLCEKPLAASTKDGRAIVEAARAQNRLLSVAHCYRFLPNRRLVARLIDGDVLKTPLRVLVEQGTVASWPTTTGYSFAPGGAGAGVLLNEGIHTIDMLRAWLGELSIDRAIDDAVGGAESNALLELRGPRGTARLRLSRTATLRNTITVQDARGVTVTLPLWEGSALVEERDGVVREHRLDERAHDLPHLLAELLDAFAAAIDTGAPVSPSGADGLAALELIDACRAQKRARPLPDRAPVPGAMF